MAEYAGWILTRFEVGHDGQTACERTRGKSAKVQGMEFAEGVVEEMKRRWAVGQADVHV